MKIISTVALSAFLFSACASFTGGKDYIAIGPQNLSVQVKDYEKMPVFTDRADIKRIWSGIGLIRIKKLPKNLNVIKAKIAEIKKFSASRGANAVIIEQYFDGDSSPKRPIMLAGYLVKYLDDVSQEDSAKITEFNMMSGIKDGAG
jgi:hypothetical protein